MVQSGLAHVVGFAAEFRDNGVRGACEDDAHREILIAEDTGGFSRQEVVTSNVHQKRRVPLGIGELPARTCTDWKDCRRIDDAIECAEFKNGKPSSLVDAFG